jgi:hypothetical protein
LEQVNGTVWLDQVTLYGTQLTVAQQHLGNTTSTSEPGSINRRDGLIGFSQGGSSFGDTETNTWYQNLCGQGSLDECRYALVLRADSTGTLYLGGVERSAFQGELSVAPVQGPVHLITDVAVNGTVIEKDVEVLPDSGTTVIFGYVYNRILLQGHMNTNVVAGVGKTDS